MSADDELGYVYLPTTSVTNDMYGGASARRQPVQRRRSCASKRRPASASGTTRRCITICSTTTTRRRRSSRDITVDGKTIKALVQVTKQSWAYVLDRVTGKPVWPIVEKPVPAVDGARREGVADAAVSDEAAGLRSAGHHRRRSDRLHAGAARGGARDLQAVPHRSGVHAAVDRGRRAGRHEGHDRAAGIDRRRRLDGRGVRSGDRHAVRAVDDESLRRQPDSRRSEGDEPALSRRRRAS